jgi:hypothetical protein
MNNETDKPVAKAPLLLIMLIPIGALLWIFLFLGWGLYFQLKHETEKAKIHQSQTEATRIRKGIQGNR